MTENKSKEEKFTVIDGKDLVLGRLGSAIAKRLLLGESIKIVNAQEIVILGRKKFLVERYKTKISNKVVKQGPYYSRSPADLVKRAMRNMLPYKNQRGIDAFKRLKCYNSVPSILLNVKKSTVEGAKLDSTSVFYYTKVGEISRTLGYNKEK
ncbi:MAG: 50S ribosomal protein L13 [Nanoarchaeota archaeon]|nr:50S ribosomal protein L13 [Nanoarchaeota archaeon]